MKKRTILLMALILALSVSPAHPYWIYSPKTKKWVNPKAAPKATPKEQLDYAVSLYQAKKFNDASRELKKLLKAFPKTSEAAEAQYYLGLTEEAQDHLYEAFKDYQKVIDKYPFSERIQEIIQRQYDIGERFMTGQEKRKAAGIALPVENPAIEIFGKVVENSTYGPLAPKAQYRLGVILKDLGRYYEAEEAFNKLLSNYPDSGWGEGARYQIAACRAALSQGAAYDQGSTQEAKQKFEEFLREYPDAVLSPKAEQQIDALREKEAQAGFEAGLFYEKQKAYDSAKIYYQDVVNQHAQSPWAAKAMERLRIIELKGRKR